MDNLESLVLGVASGSSIRLRGETVGEAFSPEWTPTDEVEDEVDKHESEEDGVYLSDAETVGSQARLY